MDKFVGLTDTELLSVVGGIERPWLNPSLPTRYPIEEHPIGRITLPVFGSCPSGWIDLGYIGGSSHLCRSWDGYW